MTLAVWFKNMRTWLNTNTPLNCFWNLGVDEGFYISVSKMIVTMHFEISKMLAVLEFNITQVYQDFKYQHH